ncbi:hypothetical protein DFH27DRAFT_72150 [Peziza echinospora]|nr:hypothetical protein DFH27DRAFT_72150 [Peziza echinospora]
MGSFRRALTFARRCGRAIRKISCFGASKNNTKSSPAKVAEKKQAASIITDHEDAVVHEESQAPSSTDIVYHDRSICEPEAQVIAVEPLDSPSTLDFSPQPSTTLQLTIPPKSAGTGRTPSLSSSSCESDNHSEALTNDHHIQSMLCFSCKSSSCLPMAPQCSVYQNQERNWGAGSVSSGASHIGVHSPSTNRSRSERSSSSVCQQRLKVLYDFDNAPPAVAQEKHKYQFFNPRKEVARDLGPMVLDTATDIISGPSFREIENIGY